MPADSKSIPAFDPSTPALDASVPALAPSVMDLLACPACRGKLFLAAGVGQQAVRLMCAECGRAYPIVNKIPVLIAGREQAL